MKHILESTPYKMGAQVINLLYSAHPCTSESLKKAGRNVVCEV